MQAKNIWYWWEKGGGPRGTEAGLRPARLRWDDGADTLPGAVEARGGEGMTVTREPLHFVK